MGEKCDFIEVVDDVLPKSLCAAVIERFEQCQDTVQGRVGGGIDTDKKNSRDVCFSSHTDFQPYWAGVIEATSTQLLHYIDKYFHLLVGPIGMSVADPRTGQAVKLTADNYADVGRPNLPSLVEHLFRIGAINLQRYQAGSGGYPYWHSEVYPEAGSNDALHRQLLFMFYLNDVAEGGCTDFLYQELSIKPKAGRMVIAPAHFTHTHRGQVPVSNDKYILTSWLLYNRAEKIYT